MGQGRNLFVRLFVVACLLAFAVPSEAHAADCNLNGSEDVEDIASGVSQDCNGDRVADECEISPLEFGRADFPEPIGAAARGIAARDFNGDGLVDFVFATRSGLNGTLRVFLNPGDIEPSVKGFGEPTHVIDAGRSLDGMAAGDFDLDGDLDIATVNSSSILLFENTSTGLFLGPASYSVVSGTRFFVAGRVNGDDLLDLVTFRSTTRELIVHQNQGGGLSNFTPIYTTILPGILEVLEVSDVNGDGLGDLLIGLQDKSELDILINTGTTFAVPVKLDLPLSAEEIRTVDLDQDADADLFVRTQSTLFFFENSGDGTFLERLRISNDPTAFAPADIDQDGDLDVLISSRETVAFLLNLGESRFLLTDPTRTTAAAFLEAADFDRDGDMDLALATRSTLGFLWNGLKEALSFQTVRIGVPVRPHSLAIADFDRDGHVDAASVNGDETYSFHRGTGAGPFELPRTTFIVNPRSVLNLNDIAAADFDGDGDVDLTLADNSAEEIAILYNKGDASFEDPVFLLPADGATWVITAELNGDGHPDIVSSNTNRESVSIRLNDGTGSFLPTLRAAVGGAPRKAAAVDLDDDGDLDLVVPNNSGSDATILLNDGSGEMSARGRLITSGPPRWLTVADYNRDGEPDVAVCTQRRLSVFLGLGNGVGAAGFGAETVFETANENFSSMTLDVDGDGAMDVVTTGESTSQISVLLGIGDGSFSAPFTFETGTGPRTSSFADIDEDGDMDLFSADRQGSSMTYFLNNVAPLEAPDSLEKICTPLEFHKLSVAARLGGSVDRATKFIVPARNEPGLLPARFQNVARFPLHQEFLEIAFPDEFGSLSVEQYNDLVGRRETRDYYVGVLKLLRLDGGMAYGFSVLVDTSSEAELLNLEETRAVHDRLKESFLLEPLGYAPDGALEREVAESWANPGFPLFLDTGPSVAFQAYTRGVGFGQVRILDQEGFAAASERGQISFQSILVLDFAPRDVEGVVSGLVTAEPQGELSHSVIRAARRNTPNAFDGGAVERFAPFEGQLVRIEITETQLDIQPATLEEAEAFWASNRPTLSFTPEIDADFSELTSLAEIADLIDAGSTRLVPRYGGKAMGLGRLQGILREPRWEQYQETGFSVPIHYYVQFMRSNTIASALDPARTVTYEAYLDEVFVDPLFLSDSELRFTILDTLRDHMRQEGVVDPSLVARIRDRIREIMGTAPDTRVRFRSSSNIEDGLEFNGAGLYNSTSGCIEDDFDADDLGPSLCDPTQENERSITRALKRVWASLWNFRAYEERAFFGIAPDLAAMGVLVNRTFIDEAANGVAFTGDLFNPLDRRYLITVQAGEASVVSPEPGVRAERDLLLIADGEVIDITRAATSSLLEPGEVVLSNDQLNELGELMAHMDANYPLDLGAFAREQVLLDLEFKFMPDGELAVKQVRPFLLTTEPPPTPSFDLEVDTLEVRGIFGRAGASRGALEEYELKTRLKFLPGPFVLPTDSQTFTFELVDELLVGQEQLLATPSSDGRLTVRRVAETDEITEYRFSFKQDFELPDGRSLEFKSRRPILYRARGENPLDGGLVRMDESFFTQNVDKDEYFEARLEGSVPIIRFGSATNETLPLVTTRAELEDGTVLRFVERFDESRTDFNISPVTFVNAQITLPGGEERALSDDYYRLVYSATIHNKNAVYWVALDPPLDVEGVAEPVHAVELVLENERPQNALADHGAYLDASFNPIKTLAVTSYSRNNVTGILFTRGDANADGSTNLADALFILNFLFTRGATPPCQKSADIDDSGHLNIADGYALLGNIFRGGGAPLPEPSVGCGSDPTVDELNCSEFPRCP